MRVVAFVAQKGGPGKTTLARNFAVAAMQAGETVIVIDTDPQETLYAWSKRRDETEGLAVHKIGPAAVASALANARRHGAASLVVLDTPGFLGTEGALAIQAADFVLVPVRPTIDDIDAVRPVVRLLGTHSKPYAFVLSQVSPASPARTDDAASALMRVCPHNPVRIALRSDFIDAATAGLGVTEHAPRSKAASEIRLLYQFVKAQMEASAHG